ARRLAKRRLGDANVKQDDSRDHHGRGKMNGTRVDEQVVHVIPSGPAECRTSVSADREGEAPLRLVRVDRERVPVNMISARSGAFEADAHGVAADLRLAADA